MTTPTEQVSAFHYPNVFTFGDIKEVQMFEDVVARDVYEFKRPQDIAAWQGRAALSTLIRPPKFNGSLRNIEMHSMEDPYERLIDVNERGWTMRGGGGGLAALRKDTDLAAETTRGFILTADARSSGRGSIGQVQAEIWYMQARPAYDGALEVDRSAGSPVARRITKPRLETTKFIEANERSRKMGMDVLRLHMTNPLSGGLARG